MKSTTAVILLMFVVAFFHSCYCINCYQCDSTEDVGCDEIVDDKFLRYCPDNAQCASFVFKDNGIKRTMRHCEQKGIVSHSWNYCNSDRCNGDTKQHITNKIGQNLLCYTCYDLFNRRNPKCENIIDDTYLSVCYHDEECFTQKTIVSDNSKYEVVRDCKKRGLEVFFQQHCDTDGCNRDNEVSSKPQRNRDNEDVSSKPQLNRDNEEVSSKPHRNRDNEDISSKPQRNRDNEEFSSKPQLNRDNEEVSSQPQRNRYNEEVSSKPHRNRDNKEFSSKPQRNRSNATKHQFSKIMSILLLLEILRIYRYYNHFSF